jgi:hypothetical protein
MSKRDFWIAVFIYFFSANIAWTLVTISLPWIVWLIGQPFLVLLSMMIVAITVGGRNK